MRSMPMMIASLQCWKPFLMLYLPHSGRAGQRACTQRRDEALALADEESARNALRTQQVTAHETAVTNTMDSLGGSEYIKISRVRSRTGG